MTQIRRLHPRHPCTIPLSIISASGRRLGEGLVGNLSLGGAAILAPEGLEKSIAYSFLFEGLQIQGRLTWLGPRDLKGRTRRYGVHFILSVDQESRLKILLAKLA